MEIQLIIVLLIAFIVLGPERMMDLAVKLGEAMRKVREMWDEVRMQAYMEEINRKIMEEESKELDEKTEDETIDEYGESDESLPDIEVEDYNEEYFEEELEEVESREEEIVEDERREQSASHDASDGTPEGAENKTD